MAETLENRIATLVWARTVRGRLTSWEQAEGVAADIHALLAGRLDPLGLEAAADSLTPLGRAARWPQEYVEERAGFVVRAYLSGSVPARMARAMDDQTWGQTEVCFRCGMVPKEDACICTLRGEDPIRIKVVPAPELTPRPDVLAEQGFRVAPVGGTGQEDQRERRAVERVRGVARTRGYAIAEHGSRERDLDLIAVPWTDDVCSADELEDALVEELSAVTTHREDKPHGRRGFVLAGVGPKPIDISVVEAAGVGGTGVRLTGEEAGALVGWLPADVDDDEYQAARSKLASVGKGDE